MENYQIQAGKDPLTDAPVIQYFFEVGNKLGTKPYADLTAGQKAIYDAFIAMVQSIAV
jgi:hypothetical protein